MESLSVRTGVHPIRCRTVADGAGPRISTQSHATWPEKMSNRFSWPGECTFRSAASLTASPARPLRTYDSYSMYGSHNSNSSQTSFGVLDTCEASFTGEFSRDRFHTSGWRRFSSSSPESPSTIADESETSDMVRFVLLDSVFGSPDGLFWHPYDAKTKRGQHIELYSGPRKEP